MYVYDVQDSFINLLLLGIVEALFCTGGPGYLAKEGLTALTGETATDFVCDGRLLVDCGRVKRETPVLVVPCPGYFIGDMADLC